MEERLARLRASLPWIGLGAVASAALANWLSAWLLLLAPVLLVGAFLVWQLDPGREFFGWIVGLALLPILVVTSEPGCPVFETCEGEARSAWPYVVVSAALIGLGLVLATRASTSQGNRISAP